MEEWFGQQWHRFASARADAGHAAAAAHLADERRAVELLLHAGGARQRVAAAAPLRVGGPRSFWQRVAGAGRRLPLAQLDEAVLALPETVAVYDDPALNRELYLWWAALAAGMDLNLPWAEANAAAVETALARFPGLAARQARLFEAEAARRAAPWPAAGEAVSDAAPVWAWVVPVPQGTGLASEMSGPDEAPATTNEGTGTLPQRRRARRAPEGDKRPPLLLAAKGESLRTFADAMPIDRASDDEDDGSAAVAAEEIETLTLARQQGSVASRVRFDLDLPSAAADDAPVGEGFWLPEWNHRTQGLEPGRVLACHFEARAAAPWTPDPALRTEAARVRRQVERQRAALRWQHAAPDGDELDLDACVRQRAEADDRDAVYRRRTRTRRDLATLLLADLSLSTDAYANDRQRIIEVIRDALFVFGQALAGCGDAFAITGFSSVKRRLRLHELKTFDEPFGEAALRRVGAIRPGYYTRMGAALRAGTRALAARPERQKLLLLLTDGKPHDLDGYEGRAGVEDTRQAVLEARRAGLLPFALSIDGEAGEVMPQLFGSTGGQRGQGGWAWVRKPEDLPRRLATLYAQLVR